MESNVKQEWDDDEEGKYELLTVIVTAELLSDWVSSAGRLIRETNILFTYTYTTSLTHFTTLPPIPKNNISIN